MKGGSQLGCLEFLSQQDGELFDRVLCAYEHTRLVMMHYSRSFVRRDIWVVLDLACFTSLPPWQWTEELFSAWCHHLGKRKLSYSTQRTYQSSIMRFLEFLCSNQYHSALIEQATGFSPKQVVADTVAHHVVGGGAS